MKFIHIMDRVDVIKSIMDPPGNIMENMNMMLTKPNSIKKETKKKLETGIAAPSREEGGISVYQKAQSLIKNQQYLAKTIG